MFQFHKGAIGVRYRKFIKIIDLEFQFHKGAIGVERRDWK